MRCLVVIAAISGIWAGCGDNSSPLSATTEEAGGQTGAPAAPGTGGDVGPASTGGTILPAGSGGTGAGGGVHATGGIPGLAPGGAAGTGGTGGTWGGAPTTVAIRDGRITLMPGQPDHGLDGLGWVAPAAGATLTSPTCAGAPITATAACVNQVQWASNQELCVSGSVAALSTAAVGVNATEPPGGGLGRSYQLIFIYTTGTPTTGIRLVVHRKGDAESVTYCAAFTSGARIPFTSFNTRCWDGSGTFLTEADVPIIDKMALLIAAGQTSVAVSDLCFGSIYLE